VNNIVLALESAWRVLLVGLVFGAGLPAVFAVGIRAMAWGDGGDEVTHRRVHPLGRPLAWLAFAVVIAGVALGLTMIVAKGFGKEVTFDHVYPTVVDT
jgi:formate hydrogenlyase subunit 3/multisubunit Na+/H+ antiporter MnhD subunit